MTPMIAQTHFFTFGVFKNELGYLEFAYTARNTRVNFLTKTHSVVHFKFKEDAYTYLIKIIE